MNYTLSKLKNGLRVLTVPIPNMESATVTIWVNVGSRNETNKVSGISHFLEHMVFKGTRRRPSAQMIAEEIDEFGGEFNAGTSKDWTNFYIKSRKAKLPTAFDVLSDMVFDPLLKAEDIAREKGVIAEEIGMYEDTPMMHIEDIFERLIFSGSFLGRDVIGTRSTVASLERNDFVRYRKKYYGSNSILVTVSGGVTSEQAEKLAEEHLGGLQPIDDAKYSLFSSKQKNARVLLESKKNEQAHFILGFLGNGRGHKDRYTEAVLTTILGGGMSSRLFTEVREKRGLAYAVRTSSEHYDETGYVETYAGVDPKRIDEAIKVTLDEHYKLASGEAKISDKELKKGKEFLKGHLALSLEDTKAINTFFGIRQLKLGVVDIPQEVYLRIDEVSVDDILRFSKDIFVPEKLNLAIIGPYKDQGRFEKLLK